MSQSKLLRLQVLAWSVYRTECTGIHIKFKKTKSISVSLAVLLMNIPQLDFSEEVERVFIDFFIYQNIKKMCF